MRRHARYAIMQRKLLEQQEVERTEPQRPAEEAKAPEPVSPPSEFECEDCGATFKSKGGLGNHRRLKHGNTRGPD